MYNIDSMIILPWLLQLELLPPSGSYTVYVVPDIRQQKVNTCNGSTKNTSKHDICTSLEILIIQ